VDRPARGAGLAEFEHSLTVRSAIRTCRIASHRLRPRKHSRLSFSCKRARNFRFHDSLRDHGAVPDKETVFVRFKTFGVNFDFMTPILPLIATDAAGTVIAIEMR